MPLVMGKRRRKCWKELESRLHGRRRQRPEPPEPERIPVEPPARTADESDHASPEEITAYRRVYRSPRDIAAETAYQKLMRICMDAKLERGIWMRLPTDDGALSDIQLVPTPITLPDEMITARQFAAEWLLLLGEAMAWLSLEVEPRRNAYIDREDAEFVRELTGQDTHAVSARWATHILLANGSNERIKQWF